MWITSDHNDDDDDNDDGDNDDDDDTDEHDDEDQNELMNLIFLFQNLGLLAQKLVELWPFWSPSLC